MKLSPTAALLLLPLVAACTHKESSYSLGSSEVGVFNSRNAGTPISLDRIKSMSEQQVIATFGTPALDRRDGPTVRALRYNSDACTLFIYFNGAQVQFADAYDTRLRPLSSVDQCAGSIAAQKKGRTA